MQLHPGEHGDERHLDLVEEAAHALLVELGLEDGAQPGDCVSASASALASRIDVDLVPRDRGRALVGRVEQRIPVLKLDSEAARPEPAQRE